MYIMKRSRKYIEGVLKSITKNYLATVPNKDGITYTTEDLNYMKTTGREFRLERRENLEDLCLNVVLPLEEIPRNLNLPDRHMGVRIFYSKAERVDYFEDHTGTSKATFD